MKYYYSYKNLARGLRQAGFKVKYALPKLVNNTEAEDGNMYIGLIYAKNSNFELNNNL